MRKIQHLKKNKPEEMREQLSDSGTDENTNGRKTTGTVGTGGGGKDGAVVMETLVVVMVGWGKVIPVIELVFPLAFFLIGFGLGGFFSFFFLVVGFFKTGLQETASVTIILTLVHGVGKLETELDTVAPPVELPIRTLDSCSRRLENDRIPWSA